MFLTKNLKYKDIVYPDIEILENKTTFLTGDSGTGKSTLLKLFNNVISSDNGLITYYGKPLENYDPVKLRRKVLLLGQTVYLFDKTIRENFYEYYRYRDLYEPNDDEIKKFLNVCCIDFDLDTNCSTMSGGERQRVYLAICISLLPNVLMLDEPTSALDDSTSNTLMDNIKSFSHENNMTLIIVSHNKSIVDNYADDIIYIKKEAL